MIRFLPRTLRVRVTILFAFVFGFISGGAGIVTYLHLASDLYRRVDQELQNKAEYIENLIAGSREVNIPWETITRGIHDETETSSLLHYVQVFRAGDDSMVVNSRKDLPDISSIASAMKGTIVDVELESQQLRVLKGNAGAYRIYICSPIDIVVHAMEEIRRTYFIFLPLALLLASACVYLITGQALKPITIAARTAEKITSHNLEERLPPPKRDDEVGELVHTLNRMIERLENAFTHITQFTADAAHELHTPLTILRGEVEVALRKKTLEPTSLKLLQSNLDEVNRLISIVESLFTLARLDAKKLMVESESVDLAMLLDQVYEKAIVLAEPKNITVELSRNEHVVINGDTYRLIQLFINLITNAIRYTPEGGSIMLACWKEAQFAHISVRDTGIGIPAADLEKIFNRFYRVDKARSREMGGSGLGLAIVQWIVDLHKGKINVESEVGKGSTFEVQLPLV